MSRLDPGFAYSQARLQARYGARPAASDWSQVTATGDLAALLQVLRGSSIGRWTARLGNRPDVHEVERRLRAEWTLEVDEIADWQPPAWRGGIRWLRWLAYLPALQKLARGGRTPDWARDDAVLGSIVARGPADRAGALRRTPLEPLAAGFAAPPNTAAAWTSHWRKLWPTRGVITIPLEALLRDVVRVRSQLAALPAATRSDETLRGFERRLELAFRRNPLSPAATVAYLGLRALDMQRLRGALAVRALREHPSPS